MDAALSSAARLCQHMARGIVVRGMASGKSKARGMRLRGGGGVPGVRFGGKLSTEMRYRSESVLESIRTPKNVVEPIRKWRILRGDFVQVTSGVEKGKRGRVLEVVRQSNRVIVEGVGIVNKFVPQPDSSRKKKVQTEAPIPVSRVNVICPETDLPTRIGYAFLEDGTKVRLSKRSGAIIPRPAILSIRRVPRPPNDGPKDTAPGITLRCSFEDENKLYAAKYGSFKELIERTMPRDIP
jgi:large subunit ribosomal protein L24